MYFYVRKKQDLITNKSNILTAIAAEQTTATHIQASVVTYYYLCSNLCGVFNLKCPQVHPINMNMGGKR